MNILSRIHKYFVSSQIEQMKQESQEVAHLLLRRDLQLSQANDKLQRLNKVKGEFIDMAAHQLRTPITNVKWHTELLQASTVFTETKQLEHLVQIQKSTEHMASLIDTLLYISRLELGTDTSQNQVFNIADACREVVAQLQKQIHVRELVIETKLQSVDIYTDKTLLKLVLQNLLSNAIKYTPKRGKITLVVERIDTHQSIGERRYTQQQLGISVQDTGYGIPKAEQSYIFNRLYRASNAREKNVDGTGLGLYLAKLVVERLGGEVWFISYEGQGTLFYLTIPWSLMTPLITKD